LLMADIDYADAFLLAAIEEGDDVPTREGEDGVDPFGLQGPGDELAAVNFHSCVKSLGIRRAILRKNE
jgi:hypothetical protein